MTAQAAARDTVQLALVAEVSPLDFPVAAATTLWAGSIIATDASGNAVPASASTAVKIWGRCEATVINTVAAGYGNAGDRRVRVLPGIFSYNNGDAITAADVGKPAFAGDDNTVYLAAGTGKSYGGIIYGLNGSQVWVGIGPIFGASFSGGDGQSLGTLPAFSSNAIAPAATAIEDGGIYDVPTTAAASTITLPAASPIGTTVYFCADGTKNGHTVQYLDATGAVALTTALTASKRHLVVCVKESATIWVANAYVSP